MIHMQYPYKAGDRKFDGRIHDINPITLIRLGNNNYNSEYYCLIYSDLTLQNRAMMTILRRDKQGIITKIPLENYDRLEEFVISHPLQVVDSDRLLIDGMTICSESFMPIERVDSYIRGTAVETPIIGQNSYIRGTTVEMPINQEQRSQTQVQVAVASAPPSPPSPPTPPTPPTPPNEHDSYLTKEKEEEKQTIFQTPIKFYKYRDRYFLDEENLRKIKSYVITGEYYFSSKLFFTFDKDEHLDKKLYEVRKYIYDSVTHKKTVEIFDRPKKKEKENTGPNKVYVYNDRFYITKELYTKTLGHPPVYNLGKMFSIYEYDFSESFGDLGMTLYIIPEHFCSRIPNQEIVYITKRDQKRFR